MGHTATDGEPHSSGVGERPAVASAVRVFEGWVESQLAYRGLPGMAVGIVLGEELIWARGFGVADRDTRSPATPRTRYPIASVSKLFTSTAVLQLRDRGLLRLDDPVEKHLSWFHLRSRDPEAPTITIRHLLTHTAGLPREAPFPYHSGGEFPTRQQLIDSLPEIDPVYKPETKWKYSNLGFAVLGEVVAAATGVPFDRYIADCILHPLGMTSTTVNRPTDPGLSVATGYGRRMPDGLREARPVVESRGLSPAAGWWSTVEDLAKFIGIQFWYDEPAWGRQVLKGSSLREAHRVHWLSPEWTWGWGLGYAVVPGEDRDLVGHDGWAPGCQSAVYLSKEEEIGVIVLTNADDAHPFPGLTESIVERAFEWVAPAINKETTPEEEPKKASAAWRKYCGKYRDPWEDSEVLILDGELVMVRPTEPDPMHSRTRLVPVAGHMFRLVGGDPFGEHGELVEFEMEKGRVVRVRIGSNYTYPQT